MAGEGASFHENLSECGLFFSNNNIKWHSNLQTLAYFAGSQNTSRECDPVHIAASSFPNAHPVGSHSINSYQATNTSLLMAGRFSSLLLVIIPTYIFRSCTHLYLYSLASVITAQVFK